MAYVFATIVIAVLAVFVYRSLRKPAASTFSVDTPNVVDQSNSTVGGDQVGGHKIETK